MASEPQTLKPAGRPVKAMGRGAIILLALFLAGCSDPADPAGPAAPSGEDQSARIEQADQAAQDVDVEATATTGLIRGVVVDDAIRPLAGVAVSVDGTDLVQTTGADGGFGFDGLDAGTYFLLTSRERYESMRIGVVVEAGRDDPDAVRVVMLALPGTEPFIESFSGTMFIALSITFVGGVGGQEIGEDPDRLIFSMQPNASVVQMEAEWSPTSPTGEHLRMYGSVSEDGSPLHIRATTGSSPLWLRNNGTVDNDVGNGFYFGVQALARSPTSGQAPDPEGTLVVNQQVNGFAHAFHNFLPRDDWLFVRDGEHPVPP